MQGGNKFAMRVVSASDLRRMYHDEQLSQWQIAAKLKVTQAAVLYWMRKHNINSRSHNDALLVLGKSGRFTGSKNPRWNGGKHLTAQGYISVRMPEHPLADNRGYVREHRLIWYEKRGPIPKGWHVHHRNGDKADNRLENLDLMTPQKHRAVLPDLLRRIAALEAKLETSHVISCSCQRSRSS